MRSTIFALAFGLVSILGAQDARHLELDSPFGSFVEDGFPFFTQTVDCRDLGAPWPEKNLTPRGVILKLGGGYFACWDTDLLRVALVWSENERGEYLTMTGMAPGSYRLPNKKAPAGQKRLPTPLGTPLAANGLYPGWGDREDRRKRHGADPDETGLGPAPGMRWIGIELKEPSERSVGWTLRYEVGGIPVEETWRGPKRYVSISPRSKPLTIHWSTDQSETIPPSGEIETVSFSHAEPVEFELSTITPPMDVKLTTGLARTDVDNGLKIEEVELPLSNPWKRNVRLSGLDFFQNGDAALSTFDGDVWLVSGIDGKLEAVSWQRFASGLHEPLGLEIVDDQIYVFSRNGIVRPRDLDGDGIADFYENFSNVVPQTSETREFAQDIVAAPDGGFYLAKGGQVAASRGIANGTVVRVSPDGKNYEVIARGLRQPYIGIDPKTGMVTSSDQQGNWIPTTPLQIIEPGKYYGFQPAKFKDKAIHPEPIEEAEIWIPHFVNQSGASQVWLRDSQLGSLDESLIHIGYNRPEIFKIYLDQIGDRWVQGGIAPISHRFASGLLKGRVHPVDGSLWLTGFKIWGTSAEQISGLYRITTNGEEIWTPEELVSGERGVLIRFPQPVNEEIASNLASYSADRWNYLRSHHYGSGHYRLDGEPGQESLPISSVKMSKDRRSVFLGIPDMKPCHTLRITYRVPSNAKESQISHAYYTIHQVRRLDLSSRGFADDSVNLEPPPENLTMKEAVEASIELGEATAIKFGCIVCHAAGDRVPPSAAQGGAEVAVGPPWNGLWKSKREFTDGTILKQVDEVYLKESILDPSRKVAVGYQIEKTGVGMPSYLGVLTDHEIESLVLYIESLQKHNDKVARSDP